MTSLLPLLLAVGVQALADLGIGSGLEVPWAVPLVAVLPYLGAAGARRALLRGRFRGSARWGRVVRYSGVLAFAIAVFGFGWTDTVARWTGAQPGTPLESEGALFLSLAPFLVLQALALHAEARLEFPSGTARAQVLSMQLRGFALVLAPVALYVAIAAAADANPVAGAWLDHVGLAQAAFGLAVVALIGVVLPLLLRYVWDTVPVPEGATRRLLEAVAERARFRPSQWLVWRTGNTLANAAVVGMVPWGRTVLFTDQLLALLGPRELVAVVAHELGHARRRHVWILLAWATTAVLGVDLLLRELLRALEEGPLVPVGQTLGQEGAAVAALAFAVGFLALGAVGFGWVSRRLELDADLFCAELTDGGVSLANALREVGGAHDRDGWRHFSARRRVRFLAEMLAAPQRVRRFKRRIVTIGVAGGIAMIVCVALEVRALAARLPYERIDAAFALARYEEASRLAAQLPDDALDEDERVRLQLMLDVGRSVGDGASGTELVAALERTLDGLASTLAERDGAESTSAAFGPHRAALAARTDEAFALATLAGERGAHRARPLADALRAARAGDRARASEALRLADDALRGRYEDVVLAAASALANDAAGVVGEPAAERAEAR